MKKLLLVSLTLVSLALNIFCQKNSHIQPATLGIHFVFNDFATAQLIRATSLSQVLREHRFGKLKDMSQGLALSYGMGLCETFDFSSTIAGSFLAYPFNHKPASASDFLLLEADACIRGKMFSDRYWFVPYLQAGVGVSKYQGYWGTFIPAGVGLQISFFGEAYLQINSQYRIAVTETTTNHFIHSIGLVGNIGRRS